MPTLRPELSSMADDYARTPSRNAPLSRRPARPSGGGGSDGERARAPRGRSGCRRRRELTRPHRASRVVIFDHTLRSGEEAEREAKLIREPVLSAHNDYTEWSGPNRVREFLPDEAEELLKRRFAIIQVWRAINRPIQSNPLALADAKSVALDDLLVAERRYPHRVGQTYRLKYNPDHRWFYFPEMRRDEALVFKVYDSAKDGRARFTPHTSFNDPRSPAGAPPRQSIEVRAFAFFDS